MPAKGSIGPSGGPGDPAELAPASGPRDTGRLPKDALSEQAEYAAASRRRPGNEHRPRLQRTIPFWMLVTLALTVVAALAVAPNIWPRDSTPESPATNSAAAGFARDMQVRSAQAVEMSRLIRDRSSDPKIASLAYDIATTSRHQNRKVNAWMRAQGVSQNSTDQPLAWMHAASNGPPAPGTDPHAGQLTSDGRAPTTASPEIFEQLEKAHGTEAEILFLELMLAHHQADIEMAEAVIELGDDRAVSELAKSIIDAQARGVQAMERMLASRAG